MHYLKCGNMWNVSGKCCSCCVTDSESSVNTAEPMSFVESYNSKKRIVSQDLSKRRRIRSVKTNL